MMDYTSTYFVRYDEQDRIIAYGSTSLAAIQEAITAGAKLIICREEVTDKTHTVRNGKLRKKTRAQLKAQTRQLASLRGIPLPDVVEFMGAMVARDEGDETPWREIKKKFKEAMKSK